MKSRTYWLAYPVILYVMLYFLLMGGQPAYDRGDYMANTGFVFSVVVRPYPEVRNYEERTVKGVEYFYYAFYPIDCVVCREGGDEEEEKQ